MFLSFNEQTMGRKIGKYIVRLLIISLTGKLLSGKPYMIIDGRAHVYTLEKEGE